MREIVRLTTTTDARDERSIRIMRRLGEPLPIEVLQSARLAS